MTVQDKIELLATATACHTNEFPELGIPALRMYDGVTGVNSNQTVFDYLGKSQTASDSMHDERIPTLDWNSLRQIAGDNINECEEKYGDDPFFKGFIEIIKEMRPKGNPYISFPSGINIGATWNEEIARLAGESVGWELRNAKIDVCFGPNVDIQRDPLGGRNYEMYGEDPLLVGKIGASFIQGLQSTGIAACAKHLIANNQETRRNTVNEHISLRALEEIYSTGFRYAIRDGDVKMIMAAYNAVNGKFATYNAHLMKYLLRECWHFNGVVVTDWGGASQRKDDAILSGMDILQPGPINMSDCHEAYDSGKLTMTELDTHVIRILNLITDLKEQQKRTPPVYNEEKLLNSAVNIVSEGCVLLKNENSTLPLSPNKNISFWGNGCHSWIDCGSGSTYVTTSRKSNLFKECTYYNGEEYCFYEQWIKSGTFIYVAKASSGESSDRDIMDLDMPDREEITPKLKDAKKRGLKTVVILNISGPVDMRRWITYADAILCIFIPGCMGGHAAAKILFGKQTPGGKLPITFPMSYSDSPAYPNFPGEETDVYYGEGIFVGYRYYEKKNITPLFPFGYGLSYTTFQITPPSLIPEQFNLLSDNSLEIPVDITNTGEYNGSEVLQIYLEEIDPHLLMPKKQLKAFKKVHLKPGEHTTVLLSIQKDAFSIYDPEKKQWIYPVGMYRIHLGTSSRDIICTYNISVTGNDPYAFGPNTYFKEFIQYPEVFSIIRKYLGDSLDTIMAASDFFADQKLGNIFNQIIISKIPDQIEAAQVLEQMYSELKNYKKKGDKLK